MTQALPLHDELMQALQHLIPRTAYQDSRRLNTLVWAITGLCLTQTVRLSAWAEVLESRRQHAARRIRRFSRWLHHPAIVPSHWYQPVVLSALSNWSADQRWYIALDTTVLSPFVLIRASLIYRGRALPLTWRVLRHPSAQVSFDAYHPVLEQLCALVPPGQRVPLLADRGFAHERLLLYLRERHFQFRVRLPGDTLIQLEASSRDANVSLLCPPVGQARFVQQAALFGTAFGPVSLALATPFEHPDDPWYVASSEPSSEATLQEYALRFDIEESFRDDKSGGFQLQSSRLATPDALERLLLVLAMATLYLTSLGTSLTHTGKRSFVDHHWDRGLSYLQLGARWCRMPDRYGWQTFVPFQLEPAPAPFPVLVSRRTGRSGNHTIDPSTAA